MKRARALVALAVLGGAIAVPAFADAKGQPPKWACVPINPANPFVLRCGFINVPRP